VSVRAVAPGVRRRGALHRQFDDDGGRRVHPVERRQTGDAAVHFSPRGLLGAGTKLGRRVRQRNAAAKLGATRCSRTSRASKLRISRNRVRRRARPARGPSPSSTIPNGGTARAQDLEAPADHGIPAFLNKSIFRKLYIKDARVTFELGPDGAVVAAPVGT